MEEQPGGTFEFAWHHQKSEENREKHGISFEEAETVFYDPLAAFLFDELPLSCSTKLIQRQSDVVTRLAHRTEEGYCSSVSRNVTI